VHFSLKDQICQGQTLNVQADPPFNVLLHDPLGRRIGFDPVSNAVINEIGGNASYTGLGTDVQMIDVDGAIVGSYNLTATGNASGPYSITVMRLDEEGEILDIQSVTGVASPGTMTIPLNIMVPEIAAIDIYPGTFPNLFNPRSTGNTPLAILTTKNLALTQQLCHQPQSSRGRTRLVTMTDRVSLYHTAASALKSGGRLAATTCQHD
jgi:hypothetical protein